MVPECHRGGHHNDSFLYENANYLLNLHKARYMNGLLKCLMFTFREEDNEETAGGGEELTADEGVFATEPVQSVHGHQHSGHHEHACHIRNRFSFRIPRQYTHLH